MTKKFCIDCSLNNPGVIVYKAVLNGEMMGGAIIVLEGDRGHLDFLYVKHSIQGKLAKGKPMGKILRK